MFQPAKERLVRLLRRSEQYTKTDMVYLTSGAFWTTYGQVVVALCSIPLSIVFANLLTPNEYGIYRYVLTVSTVIGAFALTGLPLALIRAAARAFEGSLQEAFWLNLRWSAPMILISLIGAGYYAVNDNYVLAFGVALIGIFSPLLNSGSFFSAFLTGKREFRINTVYSNRRTLIHTLVILGTIFVYPEPAAALFAFFAIQTTTALYYYRKTVRMFAHNDGVDPEMKNLGKHLSFLNIFATLTDKIDALLLFQYIGAVELAIYSFAEMVPDLMNRFNKNIAMLAVPKLALRENYHGLWKKTFLISLVLLPAVVLYVISAPFIFTLLFPAYMESVPFTQALAVLVLINVTLPSAYIDAQGAIKAKYMLAVMIGTVKILAIGGGVIFFGIWGAILGRFVSRIFGVGLTFVVLRQLR